MCTSAWGLTTLTLQAWLIPVYKSTTKSLRWGESGSQEKPSVQGWLELLSCAPDKLRALGQPGLPGMSSRKSGAWKEHDVEGAKEGFASSQGWMNSAQTPWLWWQPGLTSNSDWNSRSLRCLLGFDSLGVETSLGLSLKGGKEQHKADNKFFGSCLQSFIFRSGGSGNPNWLWGFGSVLYASVSYNWETGWVECPKDVSGVLSKQLLLNQTLDDFRSLWGQLWVLLKTPTQRDRNQCLTACGSLSWHVQSQPQNQHRRRIKTWTEVSSERMGALQEQNLRRQEESLHHKNEVFI